MWFLLITGVALVFFILIYGASKLGAETGGKKVEEPRTIEEHIQAVAKTWGVAGALIKAVVKVESNFNPWAHNSEGTPADLSDDSYGLMQVTLPLAEDYGYVKEWKNPTEYEISRLYDIKTNLTIGTRFLKYLLGKYPFDVAVQMYNTGERGYNVLGYRATDYLGKVTRYYNEYKSG